MKNSTDWRLLARFLSGECSQQEKDEVADWIRSDPEHQKQLQSLEILWNAPEAKLGEPDIYRLWLQTAAAAGITSKSEHRKRAPFLRWLPIAAVLLAAVFIPYFIWRTSSSLPIETPLPEFVKIHVNKGEQTDLTLPDGTLVTLDAGSLFEYPQQFQDQVRNVYLDGEGLFEVTADPLRPFIIHAHGALVQVVGTRFNVRAWQGSNKIEVTVSEGSVFLRSKQDARSEAVMVEEGQLCILTEGQPPSKPRPVNVEKYLGWVNKEADFVDVPLREILFQLERWYNIRIILRDKAVADEHLTVSIEHRPVNEILALIATLAGQDFERRGDIVIFKPVD